MNGYDLDALARRSGLRAQRLGRRAAIPSPLRATVICAALALAVVAVVVAVTLSAARPVAVEEVRAQLVQRTAPRLCAARWPRSVPLFVESGEFSGVVACGRRGDRIVLGRVEIAYPNQRER